MKASAVSQLPVGSIAIGAGVFTEDARAVVEQLHWAHGERVCVVLFGDAAGDTLPTTAGWVEVRRAQVWVDPDATTIELGSVATLTAANTASVRYTIGAATATTAHTAAGNGQLVTATIATSSSGTGWQLATVEINHTAGSATADQINFVSAQLARMNASAMPDPTG